MEKTWHARWIMDERFSGLTPMNLLHKQSHKPDLPAHDPTLKNVHTLFRKTFTLTTQVDRAELDITADDYYKLYVNGQFVGQGPAPGYHTHYFYNRYDVTSFLTESVNVLAVHVYYQGLINRVWNSGDYRQGLIAELFVNDSCCLVSDASWKTFPAQEFIGTETTGYETQYLEHLDSRLKVVGWCTRDYDDRHWQPAREHTSDDHHLVLQPTPPLSVYEIRPQVVEYRDAGYYFLDFGQEIAGQFMMQANGEAGQMVEIRCGEELEETPERRVRFQLRCNCTYQERWTLSGQPNVLEHYDYKAFRYVEVLAPAHTVAPESFCAVVRHYPFDETACTFESSNRLLNDIWRICRNGVKYGTQESYLDCPSREKGQYLGDSIIIAPVHAYLTGDLRLWKKSLQDFALSTSICPGMMAVAPGSFMQEIADYSLLWPFYLWNYYWHSGDLEFLRVMYPVAEGIMAYFRRYQRADGLLENVKDKWNLVDWPANLRDGYDFDLSPVPGDGCHNVINAFYCGAVKTMNAIRAELHIPSVDEFPKLKQAFVQAFYRPEIGVCVDSTVSTHAALHANVLSLLYDLVPLEAVPRIVALILQKRLNCGVYFAYFVLKALSRIGAYDLVYDLISSEDEHSWANMLQEGATTCFEAWGKNQKWNTSLCHPWASTPILVIIEDLLGIRSAKPGWAEIRCAPHLPNSLEALTLEFPTIRGKIRVNYEHGQINHEIIEK